MKRKIIFSGINITAGGPLTILRHMLSYAEQELALGFEVYALVRSKDVLSNLNLNNIKIIEFPNAQRTVFHKLYYEYIHFKKVSAALRPYLWFSLNDCTPSVNADKRVVYIHNATSLYELSAMDLRYPSRVVAQKFYYRLFLQANLHKNDFVVVQQKWLKEFVIKSLHFKRNVLIHRPVFSLPLQKDAAPVTQGKFFLYPAKAEVYKNIHTLINAFKLFSEEEPDYTLVITIRGDENRYAKAMRSRAATTRNILFVGALPFNEVIAKMRSCTALVFPSKLETWGLPLSEAMSLGKQVIASDLPYARETLMGYSNTTFFNPDSSMDLAQALRTSLRRNAKDISPPGVAEHQSGLDDLFARILSD